MTSTAVDHGVAGAGTTGSRELRAAAGLLVFAGLGFGLPCVWAIRHLHATGKVWTFLGYPTYGGGPFEDHRVATTVPLLIAFCLVCGLHVVAGLRLWNARRDGAILALALVPAGALFWWGFALPVGPALAAVSTALIIRAWNDIS